MTSQLDASLPTQAALGRDTVLVRKDSPGVEWVSIEREIVAWNAERESLHLLDPIASLVFQLCDGDAPLEVTIRELAESFGQDVDKVAVDVLAFAASLEDTGLVERVR